MEIFVLLLTERNTNVFIFNLRIYLHNTWKGRIFSNLEGVGEGLNVNFKYFNQFFVMLFEVACFSSLSLSHSQKLNILHLMIKKRSLFVLFFSSYIVGLKVGRGRIGGWKEEEEEERGTEKNYTRTKITHS